MSGIRFAQAIGLGLLIGVVVTLLTHATVYVVRQMLGV